MLPILFTLPLPWGPQPIYAFGVMLALALVAGYVSVERFARRTPLGADVAGNAALFAALAGLLGARLLYVLENRETFERGDTSILDLGSGGVSAYGGLLGGTLAAAVYLRLRRASLAHFADAAAPGLALGMLLARIGCYLYGCDFGDVLSADAPGFLRAIGTFPRWHFEDVALYGSPAFLHHVQRYGLSSEAAAALPVHPLQLYEAAAGLGLFVLALVLWRQRRYPGAVILPVAFAYGLVRFAVEYLRDETELGSVFGFSSTQLFSLSLMAGIAVTWSAARGRARRAQ